MENQSGEVKQPENYILPRELVGTIVQLINTLPYGRVALIAGQLGQLIDEQNKQANSPVLRPDGGSTDKFPMQ